MGLLSHVVVILSLARVRPPGCVARGLRRRLRARSASLAVTRMTLRLPQPHTLRQRGGAVVPCSRDVSTPGCAQCLSLPVAARAAPPRPTAVLRRRAPRGRRHDRLSHAAPADRPASRRPQVSFSYLPGRSRRPGSSLSLYTHLERGASATHRAACRRRSVDGAPSSRRAAATSCLRRPAGLDNDPDIREAAAVEILEPPAQRRQVRRCPRSGPRDGGCLRRGPATTTAWRAAATVS